MLLFQSLPENEKILGANGDDGGGTNAETCNDGGQEDVHGLSMAGASYTGQLILFH